MDEKYAISDDEIDIEEITKKIKENVRRRKEAEILPANSETVCHEPVGSSTTSSDIAYLNANSDIDNNAYFIGSNLPCIGRVLVKGRQLVHSEVRRYVDTVFREQASWNAVAARALSKVVEEQKCCISAEGVQRMIQEEVRAQVREILGIVDDGVKKNARLVQMSGTENERHIRTKEQGSKSHKEGKGTDPNSFALDDIFQGSRTLIQEQHRTYFSYFKGCRNVLNIGCGQGKFLKFLHENEIGCRGIDSNEAEVDFCISQGLDVIHTDALAYLEGLDNESLDGLFIDHIFEYLEPAYLIQLLSVCAKKLSSGSYIVTETINPLSLVAFMNFDPDLADLKPIHPDTLKFLMGSADFQEIKIQFSLTVSDGRRLNYLPPLGSNGDLEQRLTVLYNWNSALPTEILHGSMDYVVIGKKRSK